MPGYWYIAKRIPTNDDNKNNNNNDNNNNDNLYFTRVTQSNTEFDFRFGPQISGLYLSCFRP